MGDAISAGQAWPKVAVYPELADIAAVLGREVQPFVLLMEPGDGRGDELGFVRHWIPEEMGPGRHFAYALAVVRDGRCPRRPARLALSSQADQTCLSQPENRPNCRC